MPVTSCLLVKHGVFYSEHFLFCQQLWFTWRRTPSSLCSPCSAPQTALLTPAAAAEVSLCHLHASSLWPSGTWQGSSEAEFHKAWPSIWSKMPPGRTQWKLVTCCTSDGDRSATVQVIQVSLLVLKGDDWRMKNEHLTARHHESLKK